MLSFYQKPVNLEYYTRKSFFLYFTNLRHDLTKLSKKVISNFGIY